MKNKATILPGLMLFASFVILMVCGMGFDFVFVFLYIKFHNYLIFRLI